MAMSNAKRKLSFDDEGTSDGIWEGNPRPMTAPSSRKEGIERKNQQTNMSSGMVLCGRCKLSDQTVTILNRHSNRFCLLSPVDYELLIDVLEGKTENHSAMSDFSAAPEFHLLLLDLAGESALSSFSPSPRGTWFQSNPAVVVAFMAKWCSFDFLYSHIDDDRMFVLFSLLVGVNNAFFSSNASSDVLSVEVTMQSEEDIYGPGTSPLQARQALQQQFHRIRNRWWLLDKVSVSFSHQSAGPNASISRLCNIVTTKLRRRLFEKLIKVGMDFAENGEGWSSSSTVCNSNSSEALDPFDASFCLPLIDKSSFTSVSTLVERNLIAVFNPASYDPACKGYYLHYYMAEDDLNDIIRKSKSQPSVVEHSEFLEKATPLGILWDHTNRNSDVRKYTLRCLMHAVLQFMLTKEETGGAESQLSLDERSRSFFSVISKLGLEQVSEILLKWQLPADLLKATYNSLVLTLFVKSTASKIHAEIGSTRIDWRRKRWFELMSERALSEFRYQITEFTFLDEVVRLMATLNCSEVISKVIEEVGGLLSIARVKEYARLFVSESRVSASALITLLTKFPWLLNTWIDPSGNTLLGLCVIHAYLNFGSLVRMPLVQTHIDVESMDGLTPLMLAGDYPAISCLMSSLIYGSSANAFHVNRHHETVLHRMAASNNVEALMYFDIIKLKDCRMVELRRKGDSATALMIALSRENVDIARSLMSALGAKATTKFGNSTSLRTVDAMFLRRKSLSLALLAEFGIEPDPQVIADSFRCDMLFKEECSVAMTGMEDNSRVCKERHEGSVMARLKKQLYAGKCKRKCRSRRRLITATRVSSVHHMCEHVHDLGWSRLNEGNFSRFDWLTHLLNNRTQEMDKSIRERTKGYDTGECAICQEECKATDCSSSEKNRGKTSCGHYFHTNCWEGMEDKSKCPMCRTLAKFVVERSNPFDPEPSVLLSSEPEGQRRYKVIEGGVAATLTSSSKERGIEREEEFEFYNNVGRYKFLIDGVWVDESSPLNVLKVKIIRVTFVSKS